MTAKWAAVAAAAACYALLAALAPGSAEFSSVRRNRSAGKIRNEKLLSLFQIVTFPNDPCVGSSTKNGTCYTSDECTTKGGTNAGSCASGYGVCCTFTKNCGESSSENCTYFESAGNEGAGGCKLQICRCSDDICQLRLDFTTFVTTGPSTVVTVVEHLLNGNPITNTASKIDHSLASRCLTDSFAVTNPSGVTPPAICGTNSGEHMYVDASECCNDIVFQLGAAAVGTTLATRSWSIKISQYECSYCNLAPEGCTQYFFGSTSGLVKTYNFDGGRHLASQSQNICVRRERGNCRICWATATSITDFAVSGAIASGIHGQSNCCAYGTKGKGAHYDCVFIPGAENAAAIAEPSVQCGGAGLVTIAGGAIAATVCSTQQPFNIRFISDAWEQTAETVGIIGFMIGYAMDSTNCPPT